MRSRTDPFRRCLGPLLLVSLYMVPRLCVAEQEDKPQLLLQTAHGAPVESLACTPDGNYFASGGGDGAIKVCDFRSRRVVLTIHPRQYDGCGLAISPDGRLLAAQDRGKSWSIKLWEIPSGRLVKTLPDAERGTLSLAFSPDGKLLAAGFGGSSRKGAPSVRTWNVETGSVVRSFPGSTGSPWGVWRVRFTPDGKRLTAITHQARVYIWDVTTGETVHEFVSRKGNGWVLGYLNEVDVSPDGKQVAIGWVAASLDGDLSGVWVYDTETAEVLHKLDGPDCIVYSAAFSPDGKLLAIEGTIHEAESGKIVRDMKTRANVVTFTPDGRHLLTGGHDGSISIWEVHPPEEPVAVLTAASSAARALAFNSDGTRLAAGDWQGHVVIWDTQKGEPVKRMEKMNWIAECLAFSHDGRRVVGGNRSGHLYLWDTETGKTLWCLHRVYNAHDGRGGARDITFSPDDRLIASLGALRGPPARAYSTLKIRDAETGRIVRAFKPGPLGKSAVAFSPDSSQVASPAASMALAVGDARTGKLAHKLEGRGRAVSALAFSPDGKRLVSRADGAKEVKLWDLATAQCLRSLPLSLGGSLDIVFSPDGRRITALSGSGDVRTWDAETGAVLTDLEGSIPRSSAAVLSPDCTRFAASDPEGIGIWDAQSNRLLARLISSRDPEAKPAEWLVTTPEGYYKGTTDAARAIAWRVGTEVFPVDAYRDVFYRPDLVEKALRGESLEGVRVLGKDDIPPEAKIVAPDELAEVGSGHVTLTVVAQGPREVRGLEIYTNGRRASADLERGLAMEARGLALEARDFPSRYRITKTFVGSVPLPPGEERVRMRVVAVDEAQLRSRPVEVTVLQRDSKPVRGILHVLAVGISEHANPDYDLAFADDDAKSVAEAIRNQAGPDKLYSGVRSIALTDAAATSQAVQEELRTLVESATLTDTVVLFLAGHGVRDDKHNYYLATHEVDLARLDETAVPWDELRGLVRSLRAKQVLVLLDTCHAAGALGRYTVTTQALGETLADRAGVMVLASSSLAEKSYESTEWGHGAFTKAFLEALSGEAGRRLSPGVLEDFVGTRVVELTKGRQHPYVPIRTQFPAGTPILMGG